MCEMKYRFAFYQLRLLNVISVDNRWCWATLRPHYHPIRKNHLFDLQFINDKTDELTSQNTLYSPQISAFSPLNNRISQYHTPISVPVPVRLSTLIVMTAVTTFQLFIIFIVVIDCYKCFVTITSLYRYRKNTV